jgi:hypothetical protein
METNFNFKSQICTSITQSKRLLSFGLKKETADMFYFKDQEEWILTNVNLIGEDCEFIPAWSYTRLAEIILRSGFNKVVGYTTSCVDDPFKEVLALMEFSIQSGRINKKYLE